MATAKSSGISVPLKAGSLTNFALRDANGDGADVAAQYDTPDGKILGTIFLYAPTYPDPGLTFLATDESIRRRFGSTAQKIEDELVPVSGVPNAGRKVVYTGIADRKLSGDPDGRIYSAAAFVRAGPWMVKVRVSGPISRSAEIGQNLDSLLSGLQLGDKVRPLPQARIEVSECTATAERPQIRILHPQSGEALGLMIALDPVVQDEKGVATSNPIASQIGGLCREAVEVRDDIALQTFRVTSASPGQFQPRRVMLYGDAGIMLLAFEHSENPGQYFLSRHSIGRSFLFGRTTAMPSEAELKSLLFNPDKQPAVISMTTSHPARATTITVNCSLTSEGCEKEATSSK